MLIALEEFTGKAPRWHPRALGEAYGQVATLTKFDRRTLAPYKNIDPVFTTSKVGTMGTVYRFGRDTDSDTSYWFHWAGAVSVIRSPANGADNERTYIFGDGAPKVTDSTIALSGGGTAYPINTYILGLPRPGTPSATVSGTPTSDVPESRSYAYSYVNAWGEEGPLSLPTADVDVKPGEVVTLDVSDALPSGDYNLTGGFKRIYRTGTGETRADFMVVDEIDITDTSYVDSVAGGSLGETAITLTWEAPPSDIVGAALMPNGVILAWKDNEIWPSEPFVPYAYPPEYVLTTDSPIVGIAVVGMTALVVTTGQPYLVGGVHPESFTMEQLDIPQAGASRRAIVNVNNGVAYVSPDGIVFVSGRTAELVTKDLYRREDWQALSPDTMHMVAHENRLFCFYEGDTPGGLIFDFFGERQSVVDIGQFFSAAYVDPLRDALFLCGEDTLVGAPGVAVGTGATQQPAQISGVGVIGVGATEQVAQTNAGVGNVLGDVFGTGATTQAAQTSAGTGAPEATGTGATSQAAQTNEGTGSTTPFDISTLWLDYGVVGDLSSLAVNDDGTGGSPSDGQQAKSWLGENAVVRFSNSTAPTYNAATAAVLFTGGAARTLLATGVGPVAQNDPFTLLMHASITPDSTKDSAGMYVRNAAGSSGTSRGFYPLGAANNLQSRFIIAGGSDTYVSRSALAVDWFTIAYTSNNDGTGGHVYIRSSAGKVYSAHTHVSAYEVGRIYMSTLANSGDMRVRGWAFHDDIVTEAQLDATHLWMLDNA